MRHSKYEMFSPKSMKFGTHHLLCSVTVEEPRTALNTQRSLTATLSAFSSSFVPPRVLPLTPSRPPAPPHTQPELSAAQRSLQGRRELLEQACLSHSRKRQVLSTDDLKHLIVDDKHSLIYCYVPKVGSHELKERSGDRGPDVFFRGGWQDFLEAGFCL